MADLEQITAQYARLKAANAGRDDAMRRVNLVRRGRMQDVYPDLFPDDGPYNVPIVANMVDIAARDTAEVLAPLPAINCSSSTSVTDKAKKFAEKRTKIANNYVNHCGGQRQMYTAADRYVTYGFVGAFVELDHDSKMPFIKWVDSMGLYYLKDRFSRTTAVFQQSWHTTDQLCALYPEYDSHIRTRSLQDRVEVVRHQDKTADTIFIPATGGHTGLILSRTTNPVGELMFVAVERPGLSDDPRGQFDDVLAVQVAKSRFALLALEAAGKAVGAPLALPNDVMELAIGPDAILRSANPEKIRRIPLDVPREAFAEQAALDDELRQGSRYPDARNGEVDGSIVTGRGVQALMSGFDTQIRTGQAMFAEAWAALLELCFKVDEKVWGSTEKEIRGNDNGTPYAIKYKPARDIDGDYTVDVQYGLMAGLDPNRALVFGLQARGDRLISRDFLRRQMPFALDPVEEEQRLDIEEMRDALKQAVAGYAAAIPVLAQNGQDPGEILYRLSTIIEGRQKGTPIEEVVAEAFTPQTPPPGAEPPVDGSTPVPGAPGEAAPGGGTPEGLNANGMLRGVAPGQAAMGPGGAPDLQMMLAGLTSRGEPNLAAAVSRRLPT